MNIENKLPYIDEYIELIPDLVFIKNIEGQYIHFNQIFLDFIHKTREEVLLKTDLDLFEEINARKFIEIDKEIIEKYKIKKFQETFLQANVEYAYFTTTKEVMYNNKGEKVGLFCIARNITKRRQYEIIYEDNEKLLEIIAIEHDLEKVLNSIIKMAEDRSPEIICSILLLDDEKRHLYRGFAPSLPDFYNEAIEGIEIGEKVGSCGASSYKRERVIVENINEHENWEPYLELTQQANLNSCWSEPIISSRNEILGTFAIYNTRPKAPNEFELKLISSYAKLVSIAIEKELNYKALQESNEKLQASEALNKNILSSIPNLVWLKDKKGVYLACNPEFELFFGAKESEIIGKTDYDFLDDELAGFFRNHDENAMNSSIGLVNEEWITYAKTKKVVLLETTKKALKDENGNILGVLGIGHDITKRKEQLEELKNINQIATNLTHEKDTLLSLFDKGDSVLFKWRNDELWNVDYVSSSVEKLTGFTKEEFLSKQISYSSCIHQDDIKKVKNEISEAINNKLDYFKHSAYRIITKNDQIRWVLEYTVTQKNAQGDITHFIGYISDITEQINQQDILFQQSKMASMGEMISNIAHQWRQPLSIISTASSGLILKKETGTLKDKMLIDACKIINNNAQHLSRTIDDFRNFSSDTKEKKTFSVSENIRGFLNLIESISKQYQIQIVTKLDDSIEFFGSSNELIQCYMNIFSNAKDALNYLEQEKYFFIDTYILNDEINILFKDNATGFRKDSLKRVFEPYFTTKHQSQGTGLGLSMTYKLIVEGMKGTIKASNIKYSYESKLLEGAQIHITLPLRK